MMYSDKKGYIGNLEIKNRFVMAPMGVRYAAPNGEVTEQLISYYETRAKGGVGLIIVETSHIEIAGKNMIGGLGIYSDKHILGLQCLTDRIHAQGAKVAIQLLHRGRNASDAVTGEPVKLVSFVPNICPAHGRVLTVPEIEYLIEIYGEAALRAKKSGFDAVEIHGTHGYLINQFMSPLTNQRTDEYGGNFENRMRFPLRVIECVRRKVGPDFPILFRMGTQEGYPGGLSMREALPIADSLAKSGIDALHVSAGITESNLVIPNAEKSEAWNSDDTGKIKRLVGSLPVVAVGRYSSPQKAEEVLREGKADFIALGRPLLADPEYVKKFFVGQQNEIMHCIACNEGCIGRTTGGLDVRCVLNPLTSKEYLGSFPCRVGSPLNIWVVGGGPAGMEAALRAAELGNNVTLLEKTAELGGLLSLASKPPYKENLLEIVSSYKARMHRVGVKVLTNTPVKAEDVLKARPDMVFVATGSSPVVPSFCQNVPVAVTAARILAGENVPGDKVVILGGGMVGCETAEFLAAQGKEVTILELRSELAADMLPGPRGALMRRLTALNVRWITNAEIISISQDGIIQYKDRFSVLKTLSSVSRLVIAAGYRPNIELCVDLDRLNISFVDIGDCRRVGKIMDAIHGAFKSVCENLGAFAWAK